MNRSSKKRQAIKYSPLILWIKGFFDGKKGAQIVETFVKSALCKCQVLENDEVISAENRTIAFRKEAAVLISSIGLDRKAIEDLPQVIENPTTPDKIRMNRMSIKTKRELQNKIQLSIKRIAEINELLENADSILVQQISKLRSGCSGKLDIYIKGVRHSICNYPMEYMYLDTPCASYYQKHQECDEMIHSVVLETQEGMKK